MYKQEVDRLHGEVANLEARVEDLGGQLRNCEANCKKLSFLEGTHNR
jgi:hypothetical protein